MCVCVCVCVCGFVAVFHIIHVVRHMYSFCPPSTFMLFFDFVRHSDRLSGICAEEVTIIIIIDYC